MQLRDLLTLTGAAYWPTVLMEINTQAHIFSMILLLAITMTLVINRFFGKNIKYYY